MDRRTRRVSRYVDALLGDRRPPGVAPDPDDLGALAVAIDLVSTRPQAGLPHPRFVERLETVLREQTQGEFRRDGELSRRGLLRAGGLAAAAAAGVVTDRLVSEQRVLGIEESSSRRPRAACPPVRAAGVECQAPHRS
jgi:hypothetical protein